MQYYQKILNVMNLNKFNYIYSLNYHILSRMAKMRRTGDVLATIHGVVEVQIVRQLCKTVMRKFQSSTFPFLLTLSSSPEHIPNRS